MKSPRSTSGGTSTASSCGELTSTEGAREAVPVPSTSGSSPAVQQQQQKQVILNRVSFQQCEQLFRTTCRVKLQRYEVPIPTARNNVIPVAQEDAANSTAVIKAEDESRYSYTDDEVKVLPTSPVARSRSSSKKKQGKGVFNRKSSARCRVCRKTLHSKKYLKLHMRMHNAVKPFSCDSCGMSFWNPNAFRNHKKVRNKRNGICPPGRGQKRTDGEWRPKGAWNCKICGKRMKTGGSYLHHMRIHRGEKPFKCEQCGKAFGRKEYLSSHLWTHSNVWRFTCIFCEKGFHQQCNLFRHLRLHTEEKPYFCVVEDCGESFRYLDNLKNHRRLIHLKKY